MKRIAEEHDSGGRQAFSDRHRADPAAHRAPAESELGRSAAEIGGIPLGFLDHRRDQLGSTIGCLAALRSVRELHPTNRKVELVLECDEESMIGAATGAMCQKKTSGSTHEAKRIRRASVMSAMRCAASSSAPP